MTVQRSTAPAARVTDAPVTRRPKSKVSTTPTSDARQRVSRREGQRAGPLHPRLAAIKELVPSLATALGETCEVVLHDLGRGANSIVAIENNLTGRELGGPMTDLLLSRVRRGETTDAINYRTQTPSGRTLRSSTMFIKDDDGSAIGCLCLNADVTPWLDVQQLVERVLGPTGADRNQTTAADPGQESPAPPVEAFPGDIEGLRKALVEHAIANVGIPVALMQKSHKMDIVQALDGDGFFMVKESVGYLAKALGVTRYSIYNYLNEIKDGSPLRV